ncbi:hypothetical protein DL93DRAFT_2232713, partial [Clavulina sp. PMI_390]
MIAKLEEKSEQLLFLYTLLAILCSGIALGDELEDEFAALQIITVGTTDLSAFPALLSEFDVWRCTLEKGWVEPPSYKRVSRLFRAPQSSVK